MYRVLLYGRPETRRRFVEGAVDEGKRQTWHLLASTVCSDASWLLRARCLEALGLAAAEGDQTLAEHILSLLCSRELPRVEQPSPLTPRQREIARLVALGMSNREIAAHLGVSFGTVGTHVQHVLDRLGVSSRAAIAAWVGQHVAVARNEHATPQKPDLHPGSCI